MAKEAKKKKKDSMYDLNEIPVYLSFEIPINL